MPIEPSGTSFVLSRCSASAASARFSGESVLPIAAQDTGAETQTESQRVAWAPFSYGPILCITPPPHSSMQYVHLSQRIAAQSSCRPKDRDPKNIVDCIEIFTRVTPFNESGEL